MPILFSAVACDRNIVANFATCDGNFKEIAETVLSKLPACNNKMTYSHGIYLLHYIAEDEYIYFSITDKLCQRSRAFLFLNEIQRRFIAKKQSKEDFVTILAAEMYRYSEDYNTIIIRKGELDELNGIGVGCSESLLGEKILYINNPDSISYSTISHVSAIPERISVSVMSSSSEGLSVASQASEEIQVVNPTLEEESVVSATPDKILIVNLTSEEISIVSPSPEKNSILSPTPEGKSVVTSTSEEIPVMSPPSDGVSIVTPISEGILVANPTPETKSAPVISPILYVVIIGMVILIIGMAIYAFGPISCVVVTSIGIYSVLRSYVGSKDKSD